MKKWILLIIFLCSLTHESQEATVDIKVNYLPLIELSTPKLLENEIISKGGITNDIVVLHPAFRNKVILFLYECRRQGIELQVQETYRTPERQDKLKKKGKSLLKGGRSLHQHNLAIDVVPVVNGKLIWHNRKLWNQIGKIGESLGLKWGGRWKRIYDPGHFELDWDISKIDSLPMPDTLIILEEQWMPKK